MDLANFEMEAGTSSPLAGATVQVLIASLLHPNTGSIMASTTTDLNGYWALLGLSDGFTYDVKVAFGGKTKWYKGLTRHNIAHLYDDTTPDPNRNLLHNGGQDSWVERGTGPITLPNADPGAPNTADGWTTFVSAGDSGVAQYDTSIASVNSKGSTRINYTRVGGQAFHFRELPDVEWQSLRGKPIAASFQVYQLASSSELCVFIDDGVSSSNGAVTHVVGAMTTVSYTRTINVGATRVRVGVAATRTDTGPKTFYIDNGMADYGSVPPIYATEPNDALMVPVIARCTVIEATPVGDSNTIAGLFNNLAARVRDIIGAPGGDWKDTVPRTLTQLLAEKVAKLGDSMTGNLSFSGDLIGVNFGRGGRLRDQVTTTPRTVLNLANDVLAIFNEAGNVQMFALDATTLNWMGNTLIHASNIAAQSVAFATNATNAVNATNATNATNAGTATNAGNVTATIGTVPISGWARRNAGSYTGNNTGQAITVGFQARFVTITSNANDAWFLVGISTAGIRLSTGIGQSGVHIDSGNTFSVGAAAEANSSAQVYQWAAYS